MCRDVTGLHQTEVKTKLNWSKAAAIRALFPLKTHPSYLTSQHELSLSTSEDLQNQVGKTQIPGPGYEWLHRHTVHLRRGDDGGSVDMWQKPIRMTDGCSCLQLPPGEEESGVEEEELSWYWHIWGFSVTLCTFYTFLMKILPGRWKEAAGDSLWSGRGMMLSWAR